VRVHAVEPGRISLEERLLNILRGEASEPNPGGNPMPNPESTEEHR
jgi:hypothetical protein